MKKPTKETVAAIETQTNLSAVPEFYLNGKTFEDQFGILRLDRGIESMWDKVNEESLARLQSTITFGKLFYNKKDVPNVVMYKTAPNGESFKLGYVSNPSDELADALLAGEVVFNAKKKIVDASMMSDF
jgi:hypothetical protein